MAMNRRTFLRRGTALLTAGAALGLPAGARADDWFPPGIDVSHWDGVINWDAVAGAGIVFAFAKATEGTTFHDSRFDFNYAEMARVGILRGAYHFGRPGTNAVAQADFFVNSVNPNLGDLFMCLDLETTDGRSPSQVWSWTQEFVAEVLNLTGFAPFIYTSRSFWISGVGNPRDNLGCPLWVAHWNVDWPSIPDAWPDWTCWQYTSNGSVPGISGRVDLDTFNGQTSDLWGYTYY
jgi:GH25 family lysozyme M1 (1,4-beta-N-acetylmuramidase)